MNVAVFLAKASAGVFQPKVLRRRSFRSRATWQRAGCEHRLRSDPLVRNRRGWPSVSCSEPLCQSASGASEPEVDAGAAGQVGVAGHFQAAVAGLALARHRRRPPHLPGEALQSGLCAISVHLAENGEAALAPDEGAHRGAAEGPLMHAPQSRGDLLGRPAQIRQVAAHPGQACASGPPAPVRGRPCLMCGPAAPRSAAGSGPADPRKKSLPAPHRSDAALARPSQRRKPLDAWCCGSSQRTRRLHFRPFEQPLRLCC